MIRRDFFTRAAAALAALLPFAGRAKAQPTADAFDPFAVKRNRNGWRMARVYREGADGFFHEIEPREVKAGDRVISLGLDGKTLWRAESFIVDDPAYFVDDGGEATTPREGTRVELFVHPNCRPDAAIESEESP